MSIVYLILGLAIGAVIGWLARGNRDRDQPVVDPARLQQETAAHLDRSLDPVNQAMTVLSEQVRELETDRNTAYASLASQVQAMTRSSTRLTDRTDKLVTALRSPQIRGRWGEIQLERVVELGGMVRHCDFDSQVSTRLAGKVVRPDLVVHLSGGRQIIVDAKVPFAAYLDALETSDPEENAGYLRRHAHQLRSHVTQLSAKDYISAFTPTPEFVVLFVPADPFLDAALEIDAELLEFAFSRNIVIATPTTLFALLRTVALGWRQEDLGDKAREVHRLGRELFTRMGTMGDHLNRVGQSLDKAVESYNSTLASIDSRIMVTARRLAEMDIPARTDQYPTSLEPVSSRPRHAREDPAEPPREELDREESDTEVGEDTGGESYYGFRTG